MKPCELISINLSLSSVIRSVGTNSGGFLVNIVSPFKGHAEMFVLLEHPVGMSQTLVLTFRSTFLLCCVSFDRFEIQILSFSWD